jgi:anthranilate synthase component 1
VIETPADLETPIYVYQKQAGRGSSFLLESVTGGEHVARYSIIGTDLYNAFILRDNHWEIYGNEGISQLPIVEGQTPLQVLRGNLGMIRSSQIPALPRFAGGLVGYLGFETVRYVEPTLPLAPHPDIPEAIFLLAETIVAFDHAYGKLLLIATAHNEAEIPVAEARRRSSRRLDGPLPRTTVSNPICPLASCNPTFPSKNFASR